MIRGIILLAAILMLALPTSALAAEPGLIEGQVINMTEGGSSVADQDVTLKTYLNNADTEASSTTTKTDAEGRFKFDGLSTGPEYGYEVSIWYQEAEYTSQRLGFEADETSKSIEIIVYDATTSDEAIRVVAAHLVITVGEGSLQVEEYLQLINESDRTYVGSQVITDDGRKQTLMFSLPMEAAGLQVFDELMVCCIVPTEGCLIDTMAAMPGIKEVAYAYQVEYSGGAYTLYEMIHYPTAAFHLLVEGEGVDVSNDQLTRGEPLVIGDRQFIHLSGQNLAPDTTLAINLSGLPKANSGTLKWMAVALILLAGGFGIGYPLLRKKKRLQPTAPEDGLERKRQRLLSDIARLDNDLEDGKISQEVYQRARSEKKAQLVELMRRLKQDDR